MEHRPIPAITVKSLQGLAVYKLARMLLTSAIPPSLEKYVPFLSRYDHVDVKETDASLMPIGCGTVFQRKRLEGRSDTLVQWNTLDDIILAEAGQCHDHLLPAKEILIEHLVKVKKWWDNEEWLGKQDNKTRRMIRDVCSDMLELFNSSCTCPIFQLTLELIFSKKAGTGQFEWMHSSGVRALTDVRPSRFIGYACVEILDEMFLPSVRAMVSPKLEPFSLVQDNSHIHSAMS
ncbi:uncharacterized protein LOC134769729 [Penaeus indicus]|uniref:uncharacterized protein LOC134769729 n=1 Tax=Penaeus indicus TaxID=29960 RepID=UPI00300D9E99